MPYVPCMTCGKTFYKRPSDMLKTHRHFCSKSCWIEKNKEERADPENNSTCKYCRKDFYLIPSKKKKGWGVFCSKACRDGYLDVQGITLICHECGQEFRRKMSVQKRNKTGRTFCSQTCARISNYKWYKQKTLDTLHYKRKSTSCEVCGWEESGAEILLSIHWLDGNHNNKSEENILVVCPICRDKIRAGLLKRYQNE